MSRTGWALAVAAALLVLAILALGGNPPESPLNYHIESPEQTARTIP